MSEISLKFNENAAEFKDNKPYSITYDENKELTTITINGNVSLVFNGNLELVTKNGSLSLDTVNGCLYLNSRQGMTLKDTEESKKYLENINNSNNCKYIQ